MNWGEFKTKVSKFLTVDNSRGGITDFRQETLRQAVIEIQYAVPQLRVGHEDVYHVADLTEVGYASRGVKPPESVITKVVVARAYTVGNEQRVQRIECIPVDYRDNEDMINGRLPANGDSCYYAIDQAGYTFMIYPAIKDDTVVSICWDGLKLEFDDDEETPFTERMASVVAKLIKAEIARDVEKDITLYQSYMGSYVTGKRDLYLTGRALSGGQS